MFPTTQWSVVLSAQSDDRRLALQRLCTVYRAPVLAYIRRHSPSMELAEDLTQGFFLRFVESNYPASADPLRGRFRAYLLTAVRRFVGREMERAAAQKRGGDQELLPLQGHAEAVSATGVLPEQAFDQAWALALVQAALDRLRQEAIGANKLALYDCLREFITELPDETGYQRIADELGMRRGTVAVAIHRLRARLRELVRAQLAETVASSADLEQELRDLRHVLGAVG